MPTPGMAAENSARGFPRAANGAVFLDGVDGVLAAAGRIAALPAKELPQRGAIQQDELDQEPAHG
jgi:hypothetical protein